jgi:hypothetical protein
LWLARQKELTRAIAVTVAAAQVGVLAVNAISRQIVQNLELRELFPAGISAQRVAPDWGPMVMFLTVFVAGVGVLVWMFTQVAKAQPRSG